MNLLTFVCVIDLPPSTQLAIIFLLSTLKLDVASTSLPNARGFLSSNSPNTDYEVEVVEIRVKEGELDSIFH